MARRLFIFGLGYSGLEIARLARAAGWQVAGTCRSEEKASRLNDAGIAFKDLHTTQTSLEDIFLGLLKETRGTHKESA